MHLRQLQSADHCVLQLTTLVTLQHLWHRHLRAEFDYVNGHLRELAQSRHQLQYQTSRRVQLIYELLQGLL